MSLRKLRRIWDRKKIRQSSKVYQVGDIISRLHEEFNGAQIFNMDAKYRVPTMDAFQNILRENTIDEIKYQSEYFDCDKFAFLFKADIALHYRINAIGIVISYASRHAFNVILIRKGGKLRVYKMEPQDDKMWEMKNPELDKYTVKGEIILI